MDAAFKLVNKQKQNNKTNNHGEKPERQIRVMSQIDGSKTHTTQFSARPNSGIKD